MVNGSESIEFFTSRTFDFDQRPTARIDLKQLVSAKTAVNFSHSNFTPLCHFVGSTIRKLANLSTKKYLEPVIIDLLLIFRDERQKRGFVIREIAEPLESQFSS